MPKANYASNTTSSWLRQRELGIKPLLGSSDAFHARVYSSLHSVATLNERCRVSPVAPHGGIFNMDFSPDGSIMVAACERKCFIMLDPFAHKIVNGNFRAHDECVNCVRFIDSRLFVTCSDDTKIKIWDTRNIKNEIILLEGHMNWVKNIEYSAKDKMIVTSAFDGNIYAWDLNCSNSTSSGYSAERVFRTSGLMRMRLNPDASKMVISTTTGYLMVVHDLNLATMADDLEGFQPNIYRLSQMSAWNARSIMNYNHLFSSSRKRNRIEFISDFPKDSDAEMISSLQIHPQGWCALSRNVNHKERAEWTCVHDIHGDCELDAVHQDEYPVTLNSDEDVQDIRRETVIAHMQELVKGGLFPISVVDKEDPLSTEDDVDRSLTMIKVGKIIPELKSFCAIIEVHVSRSNYYAALRIVESTRNVLPNLLANTTASGVSSDLPEVPFEGSHRLLSPGLGSANDKSVFNLIIKSFDPAKRFFPRLSVAVSNKVVVSVLLYPPSLLYNTGLEPVANRPRLLNYIEEPNVVKGFIKEPCFSSDGRLICSPFSFGVRLLTFSPDFQELSTCAPRPSQPVKLHEVTTLISHQNCVLSTKFSPKQYQLVSGCLNGQINWYQPIL